MMDNISYFGIADTYCGPEADTPAIKAGTEGLDFLSWTGTYNRDNKPCVDFSVSKEFLSGIDELLDSTQSRKRQ